MFKNLCDNLNALMLKKRINANELARRTGLPASTIKKIRNCDNPNPTLTTLVQIAEQFSITVSELIGEEDLKPSDTAAAIQKIPIVSWEEVIKWPNCNVHSHINIERKYNKNSFALVVLNDEWENLAKDTILIIDPTAPIEHRDLVVIFRDDQKVAFLKQIIIDENKFYLKSLITGCQINLLTPTHKILGVVMEYRKHTKAVSMQLIETTVKNRNYFLECK